MINLDSPEKNDGDPRMSTAEDVRTGVTELGSDGHRSLIYLGPDDTITFEGEIQIHFEGDNFTLSAPWTSVTIGGGTDSKFLLADGLSIPQLPLMRDLATRIALRFAGLTFNIRSYANARPTATGA